MDKNIITNKNHPHYFLMIILNVQNKNNQKIYGIHYPYTFIHSSITINHLSFVKSIFFKKIFKNSFEFAFDFGRRWQWRYISKFVNLNKNKKIFLFFLGFAHLYHLLLLKMMMMRKWKCNKNKTKKKLNEYFQQPTNERKNP